MKRYIIFLITCFSVIVTSQAIRPFDQVISASHPLLLSTVIDSPVSLFSRDSCAPPCWFGLVPGVSTAQDVATFFETTGADIFCCLSIHHRSEINSQLSYVVNGSYLFYWKEVSRPNESRSANSGIEILDSILDTIYINMNGSVYLRDVLTKLGQPDRIRFDYGGFGPRMILDYLEIPIRVVINRTERCTMRDIATTFWVEHVEYYSPRYVEEFKWSAGYGDPKLPDVPADVWEAWLNGGDDTPCTEVVEQLQALLTLTPIPIETQAAP